MKKDKRFERMTSTPEGQPAAFRPAIISEERPPGVALNGEEGASQSSSNFNGKLCVHIPKSLYIKLGNQAKEENIPVEAYVLYKLASKH